MGVANPCLFAVASPLFVEFFHVSRETLSKPVRLIPRQSATLRKNYPYATVRLDTNYPEDP